MEFEDIYATYKNDVYHFVLTLCNHQVDIADDITQETFLKAYLNIEKFEGKSSVKTWLLTIAKNTLFTEMKKRKVIFTSTEVLDILGLDDCSDLAKENEQKIILEHVFQIIHTLPPNMKEVFVTRIYSEDSYEKISKDMGISVSSAKVLMFRARRQIKKQLKEEFNYEI